MDTSSNRRHRPTLEFRTSLFGLSILLVLAGAAMHLREFAAARDDGYGLAGMPFTGEMTFAMALIATGVVLASLALLVPVRRRPGGAAPLELRLVDDARLGPAHWKLLAALTVALAIDVMKPATLGFVIPGMRHEYGLSKAHVTVLPLVALTGTAIGSLLWGIVADRCGRRATVLFGAVMFIGTAVCGVMPSFSWNLAMCFLMGFSAGGLLPVVFALVTEVVPRKERGWLLVLIGGVGGAGGYLAASTAASLLEPRFGWRALWLVGLPTGLLLLALQRAIAESPRYLAAEGRTDEARAVAARFGVVLEPATAAPPLAPPIAPRVERRRLVELFRSPYRERSWLLGLAALAWGLVNFGFLTWLPTILRNEGFGAGSVDGLLARSALVAFPGTLLVAWLYARWSSRLTLVLCCGATSAALAAFAGGAAAGVSSSGIVPLVAFVLLTCGAVNAVLVPYAAETYPTALRATGAGLVAGSGKVGGIVGPQLLTGILALSSAAWLPALLTAAPVALAATLLRRGGVETRGRALETISAGEIPTSHPAVATAMRLRR